jgi:hypothetical protein
MKVWLAAGAAAATGCLLVIAIVLMSGSGDDVPPPTVETQPPFPVPTGPPAPAEPAFAEGDWVEVATATGECAHVGAYRDDEEPRHGLVPCLDDGLVLRVTGPPEQIDGEYYYPLTGFGYMAEEFIEYHHRGDPPFPVVPKVEDALIAFVGEDGAVWLMESNGEDARSIHPGPAFAPVWSPNGRYIAFGTVADERLRSARLQILDLSGNVIADLPGADADPLPAWSPASHAIAFVQEGALRVEHIDGSSLLNVPLGPTYSQRGYDLRWSPAGDAIAAFAADGEPGELLVATVDGSILRRVPDAIGGYWSEDGNNFSLVQIDPAHEPEIGYVGTGVIFTPGVNSSRVLDPEGPNFLAYSAGPPRWRPGSSTQVGYREQLIDLTNGTRVELPGVVYDWSADGRLAIVDAGFDSVAYSGFYIVLDLEWGGWVARHDRVPCECSAPQWPLEERYFSPSGRFLHWFESYVPGVMDLAERDYTGTPRTFGNTDFSPSERLLLNSEAAYEWLASPNASDPLVPWVWTAETQTGEVQMLAPGTDAAWQPLPSPAMPTTHPIAQTALDALQSFVTSSGHDIAPPCGEDHSDALCIREAGMSSDQVAFELRGAVANASQGVPGLYFVRPEGAAYVVDHMEPPACLGEPGCPPAVGTTVELASNGGCVNIRAGPGANHQVVHCAEPSLIGEIVEGPVEADARTWVRFDGLIHPFTGEPESGGWVSVNYIRCVGRCG